MSTVLTGSCFEQFGQILKRKFLLGDRMPVHPVRADEGPSDTLEAQTILNPRVGHHIEIIVETDEAVVTDRLEGKHDRNRNERIGEPGRRDRSRRCGRLARNTLEKL